MKKKETDLNRWFGRACSLVTLAMVVLLVVFAVAGCGLETEEANRKLTQANKHQDEAEAAMARIRNIPAEWQAIFTTPTATAQQVAAAKQLMDARTQDLDALKLALQAWGRDLRAIGLLNVDERVKEYVKLRRNAVNLYEDYVSDYLHPVLRGYSGLIDLLAAGGSAAQLNKMAQDISNLVMDSASKLEECRSADKQADSYFVENKLGK